MPEAAPVPHLKTALTGPLYQLEKTLLEQQKKIECWLRAQWIQTPPPLHSSVDLRNSGFKVAPVDTNLYPAGFNNLNPEFLPLAIQAVQSTLAQAYPQANKILLIAENHTRNQFYFASLLRLREIICKGGFEVRIASLREDLTEATKIELDSGASAMLYPLKRDGDKLYIEDFEPDVVWLNNDLSGGIPEILQNTKTIIRPALHLSWAQRLKSKHFSHYKKVATEFAQELDIDPWLLNPLYRNCGEVDFMQREGETCLMVNTEILLKDIQKKYDEYGIDKEPFVIVKADAGTYGMGIMSARSVEDLQNLNRKQRTKMSASKGSQKVSKVIIQEGVYSLETWGDENAVAEPVVYMLGSNVIGGFYRVHKGRSSSENLNAPGMEFEPLAFVTPCNNPCPDLPVDECPNRFYAYGVIARLAALAAAREMQ